MEFFKSTGFKMYLMIVTAAAVIAFVVTAAILLPGYLRYQRSLKSVENSAEEEGSLDITGELLIPEKYTELLDPKWKSFYALNYHINDPESSQYWVDPSAMMLKYLKEKNTTLMHDILKKYE